MRRFSGNCSSVLANQDCPVLSSELSADHWWSLEESSSQIPRCAPQPRWGWMPGRLPRRRPEAGELVLPMAGIHNLSNALAAVAACRLAGASFADLQQALTELVPPGRRFDLRGEWQGRLIVDDYAHHPSEVDATLTMAQLMVSSGKSTLPWVPKRVVAVFQPHRYSRTAQFMERFAEALGSADEVLVAPLYSAGESPIEGVSSAAWPKSSTSGPLRQGLGRHGQPGGRRSAMQQRRRSGAGDGRWRRQSALGPSANQR